MSDTDSNSTDRDVWGETVPCWSCEGPVAVGERYLTWDDSESGWVCESCRDFYSSNGEWPDKDTKQQQLITDGGQPAGGSEHWSMDYEPVAASRYDGDRECQYEECEAVADWLVECQTTGYTGGKAFFCCQSCSRGNRIYARENDLYKTEIATELAEIIPDGEVRHVRDLQPDTDRQEDDH